ncbi:Lysophospholipase L1 [Bradyrhizobium lablabi]|uniref:Lysophospholipase L1 n=1 Tax=Bradyrhizobium lablabi TaxID=722472 RepID=A0A1M6QNU9_9BRAD|nr:SGNH/GDSL hydrolase family protein [Bradyrhizobium lablabi]SHK21687.1 Lysophospholipase L1 [Bradyrhizobium lablabi]
MNLTRVALIAAVVACAWAAWSWRPVRDNHEPIRALIISSALARFDDAIVVLGDSIVEASTLPRSLCGHAIVNAGIGGATTASNLPAILARSLGGKRAALVVVSLGTNDALMPHSPEQFSSNYRALLTELTALTPRRAVAAITLPEAGLEGTPKPGSALIDSYNAVLPKLAQEAGATFIALPAMPEHHTLDGVHLNAVGYEVWDKAILRGIESALCK